MKAPVALTWKVIGSSSAMVSAGPIPGSTPTAVPRKQPSSAQPRLPSVSALKKPRERPATGSMSDHLLPQRAQDQAFQQARADVDAQHLHEAEPHREGERQR